MKTRSVTQHLSQWLCRQQGAGSAGQLTLLPGAEKLRRLSGGRRKLLRCQALPRRPLLRKPGFPIGMAAKHLEEVARELNQSCDATVKTGKLYPKM